MLKANRQSTSGKLASTFLLALAVMFSHSADAQSYAVLHNFTGGADGGNPYSGLTMDGGGNLYGTTFGGGSGNGTVYKMTHRNGSWTLATLYQFAGGNDGSSPYAGVTFGPNGSLYGTTTVGGSHGDGTVFNLTPASHICSHTSCSWTETVLHTFQGGADGANPDGGVSFDQAGNLYGTTTVGGDHCANGCGTVYELSPSGSGWRGGVIYDFSNLNGDGATPVSGVILDNAGNLYGTTLNGGDFSYGAAYELTYSPGLLEWTESFVHSFGDNDFSFPYAGLIFDPLGNLYGAAPTATNDGGGGVFELMPSDGSWTYSPVYQLGGAGTSCGPRASLVMDSEGSLYGTTYCDGAYGQGSVFKLTHINGNWTFTTLYSFTGHSDGEYPLSNVVIDADGNLYGTTQYGGPHGAGVVWEITP